MFILLKRLKYYTKEITKALKLIIIAFLIIITFIILKFKPAYSVTIAGEELGFIKNKESFETEINDYLNDNTGNIAFRELKVENPVYSLRFVKRNKEYNDEKIEIAIKNNIETTYRTYAVLVDNEIKTVVSSEEEAQTVVANIKSDIDQNFMNIGIVEQYTNDLYFQSQDEAEAILKEIKTAKIIEYNNKQKRIARAKLVAQTKTVQNVGTIASINISRPIEGTVTSRFGARSSRRASTHTGLDIAASTGTTITPIAGGTVTFAGYNGSYGNLVIINHGNGIESYYAHCSQIFVGVGQVVDQSTTIATVGSTGNSTGPHLHLEIRQDGTPLNPENYLY